MGYRLDWTNPDFPKVIKVKGGQSRETVIREAVKFHLGKFHHYMQGAIDHAIAIDRITDDNGGLGRDG